MQLSDIFSTLASGELANRFMADGGKEIKPDKKEVVLRSINLGLSDLYNRFNLKRNKVEIQADGKKKVFNFEVILPDFLEILSVYHKHNGFVYEPNREHGYRLLAPHIIEFMDTPNQHEQIIVEYKAKHRRLTEEDILLNSKVELPEVYLNALCLFIGSRLYTSIVNQLDGDLNESNRYAKRYQEEIQTLIDSGVDYDDFDEMWLFDVRGFI